MSTADKKIKKRNLFRFLVSKIFWLNLLFAISAFFLIIWLTLLFIQSYSRHGDSKTVPNLIGLNIHEAESVLDISDLQLEVVDSTYLLDEPPSSIINQDPLRDSRVKSGRKIYLTVNMVNPPSAEVPGIEMGTSYISVREILESRGFKIGSIEYKPFQYKDVFLDMKLSGESQSLKAQVKIPKGSKIDLVLGSGLGDTEIDLPDLRNLTYIEAVSLIQLKELSLGTVIGNGTITDSAEAFVYKQYPKYESGKKINVGSMMDIWISNDEIDNAETEDNGYE